MDGKQMEVSEEPYYRKGSGPRVGVIYDPLQRRVEYTSAAGRTGERVQPLADGRHTIKIQAADWKGNMSELEWTFLVDNTLPRRVRTTTPPGQLQQPGNSGSYNSGGPSGFPGAGGVNPQQRVPRGGRGPVGRR
jgi:hypothetical protein